MISPITLLPMSQEEINTFNNVIGKYISIYGNSYILKSNSCSDLDIDLKSINEDILNERKSGNNQNILSYLSFVKSMVQNKFNDADCRNKIEMTRAESLAKELTKSSIIQEQKVLGSSQKDQSVYVILGGLVLVVGLYVLIKK